MAEIMREKSCLVRQNLHMYGRHRDLQATAMSVDFTGQWILLAGRRHLALQRIDSNDDNCLRKYHRNSKFDVSAAEWAICENSQEYCAIATSQLIEVVTWTYGDPTLIHSLRAHTRMVTDIDWHSREPHLLASCSIDTFTHLWDLRDPRKPTLSLSAVCMSGATQVGFNRVFGNYLATAHDGDLRIWDIRQGSCPIQYITAHLARIHGINWSHRHENYLTTASQDGTVKYFDVTNPRRAEKIITTSSPVWRARYTPHGNGLVTIVVPHLGRGENSLLLWSNSQQTDPICSFVGHTDVILDFAWRPNRENNSDMEFITWSRDQTLRQWKIDENLLRLCEPSTTDIDGDVFQTELWTPKKQKESSSMKKTINDMPSCSLQHEFSLLNTNIPHIEIEILDPIARNAVIKTVVNEHIIILQIKFPADYPSPNVPPEFVYCPGSTLDNALSASLMKTIKTCALQRVKKGRTCLEQCLRALVTSLKRSTGEDDKSQMRLQSPRLEGALSGALHDACIPFPKTSGAKFNSVGVLVTFCQPLNTKRISLRHQNMTPRALSAISGGYLGNVMGSQPVLYAHRDANTSSFYIQDRIRKNSRNKYSHKSSYNTIINIYDITKLLNINKMLAEKYTLSKTNISEACTHNKAAAELSGRNDVLQAWSLSEMIAASCQSVNAENKDSILHNPLRKILLDYLILHFAKNNDIQTAVMLCCTFDKHCSQAMLMDKNAYKNKIPIMAVSNTRKVLDPVKQAGLEKQVCTKLWFDAFHEILKKEKFQPLLSRFQEHIFDTFKKVYGEILYGWQLLPARIMILKHLSKPTDMTSCIEFATECFECHSFSRSPSCNICQKALLYCGICRLPVKGLANACLICGHGGHTEHINKWFKKHEVCPLGCGCHCLRESTESVYT